jgi:DNA-directed RNA polymerase
MVTIKEQKELEMKMVSDGITRYNSSLNKMMSKGLEANTSHGRAIISSMLEPIIKGIKILIEEETSNRDIARSKLQGEDAGEVSYLAMLALVDGLSKRCTLLNVAQRVGMRIEDQVRLKAWVKTDKDVALMVIKMANEKTATGRHNKRHGLTHKMNKDGFGHTEWSNEERIHVGLRVIDVIIRTTGIVALRKQASSRNKTTTYVEATPETLVWVKRFNASGEINKPRYAPCLIPPKPWKHVWGGGYYADVINRLPFVRTR